MEECSIKLILTTKHKPQPSCIELGANTGAEVTYRYSNVRGSMKLFYKVETAPFSRKHQGSSAMSILIRGVK